MSKKTLLNEQTIRRFGGLAGIRPMITSNFLTEVEVGEDELADALAAGAEAMADTLGLPVSVEVEASEDAGEEVDDLEGDFGELEGEEDEIEGEVDDLEGEEEFIDDEEGAIDDEEDAIEDETLDELINRILQEDEAEEVDEALDEEQGYDDREDEAESGRLGARHGVSKKGRRDDVEGDWGTRDEGHIKVVDDEYIMQEVSRRVKGRLANLVKENRRRKRQTKRRK